MINVLHPKRLLALPTILVIAAFVSACERSQPSATQIQAYIENYQIAHDYTVASMDYEIEPKQRGESGAIRVSGKLELREPLYAEDIGNKEFRKNVAKMLRRNRFSEREINHEIYDRVIRVAARVPNSDNEYYTFLKEEHAPGYAINFSADLIYKKGNDGFMLDGPVRHPKLLGARVIKFPNPVVDDTALVERAVKAVLDEQTRYREMMKESSALLSSLWDNDYGFVLWGRKTPYLGNENLSANERAQLVEFTDWRGVYRFSNVKPVQYRTPHASNFFELGSYATEGVATCLRPSGFIDDLAFSKSKFDQYCEFGKQYPARIELESVLGDTNEFVVSVNFEVNGASSGELQHDSIRFQREDNEVGRYSRQRRVVILDRPFDIAAHNRPEFGLVGSSGQLRLQYSGATDYELASFNADVKVKPENTDRVVTESAVSADNSIVVDIEGQTARASVAGIDAAPEEPIDLGDAESESITQESATAKTEAAVAGQQTSLALPMPKAEGEKPSLLANEGLSTELEADDGAVTAEEASGPLTKKELVKAIQIELKRLKVYDSYIDGIAGENTFLSMTYVEQQLGQGSFTKPSQEFLTALSATAVTSITPPTKPFKHVARSKESRSKSSASKGTVAGKAIKGTGRAINNAARWAGGLFRSKDSAKSTKAGSKKDSRKKTSSKKDQPKG